LEDVAGGRMTNERGKRRFTIKRRRPRHPVENAAAECNDEGASSALVVLRRVI